MSKHVYWRWNIFNLDWDMKACSHCMIRIYKQLCFLVADTREREEGIRRAKSSNLTGKEEATNDC
jgi:hypothetical protein